MLRQIKPKTARSQRALSKREPLHNENPKTTLFCRGTSSSSLINDLLTDIHSLKRPLAIRFTKKNSIHPFEDASSLEFFSQKNDASLLVFGSHSKKRPHSMTWTRCFGGQVLDMIELCVVQDTARTLSQFRGEKCRIGVKPLLSFSGAQFESPVANQYTLAKSMFLDFFRGGEAQAVDVEGLQCLISFCAGEASEDDEIPKLHMRCWRIVTRRSGQRLPRVEVEEMGPRIDFRIGRIKEADEAVWKDAMKRVKGGEAKSKKNVETDIVGDKMGRIHLGKQDLSDLQTRKMKGLKRGRAADAEAEGDAEADNPRLTSAEDATDDGAEAKRVRLDVI